jgi:hypothetical protein
MVDLTVLELHLHDSSITANAPFSGKKDPGELEGESDESDDESGGFPIVALLGLALVVVAVVAAKKYLSGNEIELEAEIEAE